MVTFQIRTPAESNFTSLFRQMVDSAVNVLQKSEQPATAKTEDVADFLRRKLNPFVKTYNVCGASTVCSDEVEGGPWLDYGDHIYLLEIPDTLKIFFKQLAFELVNELEGVAGADKTQKLAVRLEKMFRKALLSHLYYNPICGSHEVCKTRVPKDAWSV